MARSKALRPVDAREAHRIQSSMLDDYVSGVFDDYTFLFRACVIQIDHVGGVLAGPDTDRPDEPPNPKNSVLARILTHDMHNATEDLTVFWPIFSHDVMPLKPGEHVYVLYEDADDQEVGLWLARIPEPFGVGNANLTQGTTKYEDDGDNEAEDFHKAICDVPDDPEPIEVPEEFVAEEGVPFTARVGDRCIDGSNNTMIVMGRDRPTDAESGETEEAGTIDIVAGRQDEENMNAEEDLSRVYVSMKTDVDSNIAAIQDSFGNVEDGEAPDPAEAGPTVLHSTTHYRLRARETIKIVVDGKFGISVNGDGKLQIEVADEATINVGGNVTINNGGTLDIKTADAVTIDNGGDLEVVNSNIKLAGDHPLVWGDAFFDELKIFLDIMSSGPIGDLAGIPVITHPVLAGAISSFKAKLMADVTMSSTVTTK